MGLIATDQAHRDHAITEQVTEQVIAELKDGPLAHLPSGRYSANAAWLAHAVIAFNIARATAVAAKQPRDEVGKPHRTGETVTLCHNDRSEHHESENCNHRRWIRAERLG